MIVLGIIGVLLLYYLDIVLKKNKIMNLNQITIGAVDLNTAPEF